MPHLTAAEIDCLIRTFTVYVDFPKQLWPKIRVAEEFTEEGERMFDELSALYRKVFLSKDPAAPRPDREEVFEQMSKTQMR